MESNGLSLVLSKPVTHDVFREDDDRAVSY
jgi:hypothetical protein